MKVKLNIFRVDPHSNKDAEYQTFEIEAEPEETVSGVLQYIYESIDSSLAFRLVCNMQKCGECAVMVNGSPCLACERKVEPEMTIGPLPHLPIVKDLVIDRRRAIAEILKKEPFKKMTSPSGVSGPVRYGITDSAIRLGKCLECLICQSVCTALRQHPDQFPGPLGLVWLRQYSAADTRNAVFWNKRLSSALEKCTFCSKCLDVCPDGLNILSCVFENWRLLMKSGK